MVYITIVDALLPNDIFNKSLLHAILTQNSHHFKTQRLTFSQIISKISLVKLTLDSYRHNASIKENCVSRINKIQYLIFL